MYNNKYGQGAANSYSQTQVNTADRGRLLMMMYDGGIKFLKLAIAGLEANDRAKFARFVSKAQAVIAELSNTLDFEAGGQIAKDLDRLYDFMLFYLTEANLHKDVDRVNKVLDLLEIVAGAYREILSSKDVNLEELTRDAAKRVQGLKQSEESPQDRKVSDSDKQAGSKLRISL